MKLFLKSRRNEYVYELKNELMRLRIAKRSFRYVNTPRTFFLIKNKLITRGMSGESSHKLFGVIPRMKLVDEYVKLLRLLWKEELHSKEDLTPVWLNNVHIKNSENLHPDFQKLTREEIHQILLKGSEISNDSPRVVHGDLCPPNIIFDRDGCAVGLIDLGDLHVGNKSLDIAILSWTIRAGLGDRYERMFFKKLGEKIDFAELQYFRLVYDLSLPDYKNWGWIRK